jgi:hypothetical protein
MAACFTSVLAPNANLRARSSPRAKSLDISRHRVIEALPSLPRPPRSAQGLSSIDRRRTKGEADPPPDTRPVSAARYWRLGSGNRAATELQPKPMSDQP